MRVGIVIVGGPITGGGGAERRFMRLARHLRLNLGHDVTLMLGSELARSAESVGLLDGMDEGVVVLADRGSHWRSALAAWREVRGGSYDVIHLPLAQRVLTPLYLRLALPRRFAVTHSMTASYFAHPVPVGAGTRALSWLLWRVVDRIDSLYAGFVPTIVDHWGLDVPIEVSPNSFTDTSHFIPGTREAPPRLVFSGRLYDEKNPLLFVDALAELRRTQPSLEWTATMAGGGQLEHEVRRAIIGHKLNDRVGLGVYADIAPLLAVSSIYMSLQRTENYPSQALLEAMAAGNAVIATDAGETSKLVRHGDTGLLVSPDAAEVADAARRLLTDPVLRLRLGEAARIEATEVHTVERFAQYVEAFWQRAAQDRTR